MAGRTCAWDLFGASSHLLHGVQNAAMYRLQSVANIGQAARPIITDIE